MKKKMKGVLFAALLAVAGLFGVSSTLIDKQIKESPVMEKVEADSTHDIYFVVNGTNNISAGNTIKPYSNVGDNNTWIEGSAMTLQGTCTDQGVTKLLFKGQYTERYGGLNGLQFRVYDGSTHKRDLAVWTDGSWITTGNITNKCFRMNNKTGFSVPSTSSKSYALYFVPPNSWNELGNETFKLSCCFDQFEVDYISSSKVGVFNGSSIWKFTYSGKVAINYVVFNRCSSTGTWWNKSGYIQMSASYSSGSANDIWITPYSQANTDGWTSGSWQTNPVLIKKTSDLSPSSSTTRIIFNNTDSTTWAGNCGIYAWGGSASSAIFTGRNAEATLYNLTWIVDDAEGGYYYGYADIPTDVDGFKMVKVNSVDNYEATVSSWGDEELTISGYSNCVIYGNNDSMGVSKGGAKGDHAGSELMKTIIKSIDTCSSNNYNGYGAYSNLNTYFYSHATDSAKTATVASMGGSSATIETHFLGMASRQGGRSSSAINRFNPFTLMGDESGDNATTIIIIIASSVSLLSITALSVLLVKKRKNKEQ